MCINSPVSPWTSLLPLLFVVLVTAAKQGYEDYARHRRDKEVNLAPVTVIRNGVSQVLYPAFDGLSMLTMMSGGRRPWFDSSDEMCFRS